MLWHVGKPKPIQQVWHVYNCLRFHNHITITFSLHALCLSFMHFAHHLETPTDQLANDGVLFGVKYAPPSTVGLSGATACDWMLWRISGLVRFTFLLVGMVYCEGFPADPCDPNARLLKLYGPVARSNALISYRYVRIHSSHLEWLGCFACLHKIYNACSQFITFRKW